MEKEREGGDTARLKGGEREKWRKRECGEQRGPTEERRNLEIVCWSQWSVKTKPKKMMCHSPGGLTWKKYGLLIAF